MGRLPVSMGMVTLGTVSVLSEKKPAWSGMLVKAVSGECGRRNGQLQDHKEVEVKAHRGLWPRESTKEGERAPSCAAAKILSFKVGKQEYSLTLRTRHCERPNLEET